MLHPGQSALEKGRAGVVFVDYTPRCIMQQRSNSSCSVNFLLSQKKIKAKKRKVLSLLRIYCLKSVLRSCLVNTALSRNQCDSSNKSEMRPYCWGEKKKSKRQ